MTARTLPMKIYFCDICNESVPQRDLDNDRAFLRKGRVVCASCDQAMGGSGPTPAVAIAGAGGSTAAVQALPAAQEKSAAPAQASTGAGAGLAMVMASMGILLTAGVAVILFERMDHGDRQSTQATQDLRGELTGTLAALERAADASLSAGRDESARLSSELAEVRTRQDERARVAKEQGDKLSSELDKIEARLAELAGLAGDIERNGRGVSAAAATIEEMRADLGILAAKLLELEEREAAAPPPVVADSAPAANEPSWMPLVDQLQSQSSGARWSAVQALGDTGDPAVAEHLTPMLKDPDIFVRMATARILGDLAAVVGIAPLIDALEDPEASVREAAVVSLRSITSKNFKFDPTASEGDRAKKVKAWRDWWRRDGDDFAAGRT